MRLLTSLKRRKDGGPGCEQGSSLLETAIALPVLFAAFFCCLETCFAFYSYDMISEAAREGTRYAMVHGATCPTAANPTCEATAAQVNSYIAGLGWVNVGGGTMTVTTSYPDGSEVVGSRVQVLVTYNLPIKMPYVPTNLFLMSSKSIAHIVQ